MFEYLSEFEKIIVTGPHRSGTTIAAKMIAHDTSYEYIAEEAFGFYDEGEFVKVLDRPRVVVQCPALFDLMSRVSSDAIAIVMLHRPYEELRGSRERMFRADGVKLAPDVQNERQLARLKVAKGDAARIKYKRWDEWKAKGLIHHPFDVEYTALAAHPLWVAPEQRRALGKDWHNRRTSL